MQQQQFVGEWSHGLSFEIQNSLISSFDFSIPRLLFSMSLPLPTTSISLTTKCFGYPWFSHIVFTFLLLHLLPVLCVWLLFGLLIWKCTCLLSDLMKIVYVAGSLVLKRPFRAGLTKIVVTSSMWQLNSWNRLVWNEMCLWGLTGSVGGDATLNFRPVCLSPALGVEIAKNK